MNNVVRFKYGVLAVAMAQCFSAPVQAQVTSTYMVTSGLSSIQQMGLNTSYLSDGTSAALSSGTNNFYFSGVSIVPTVTGVYTLGQTSAPTDTVMLIYNGTFNKNAPTAPNAFNDDGSGGTIGSASVGSCGGPSYCPKIVGYSMTAGVKYYLIVSTYNAGDASLQLPLGFAVDGPGYLNFYTISAVTGQFVPNSTTRTGGVASVLDSLNGGAGNMAPAIAALSALSPAQQTGALEKLTPSTSRGAQIAAQNSLFSAFGQIGQRLDGLRLAGGEFNARSLAADGSVSMGLSSGDGVAKQGFWLKTYGLESTQGQKDGFAGYKGSGWGVAAGLDRQFAPGLIGGVALSYSDTSISYRNQLDGNSSGAKSTQLSLYGTKTIGSAYVDAVIAYAQQKNSSSRDTVVSGIARGNFNGDQWGARLGVGLPVALGRDLSIVPQARIEWSRVHQKSYTETGSDLALNVGSSSAERLRSSLGAQLNYDTLVADVKVQPFVRAFWNYDFKNNGVDSVASFVGGGASFVTPGQKLDRNTYSVGAGANLFTKGNFTATVGYDFTSGDSYRAHVAQASTRWAF